MQENKTTPSAARDARWADARSAENRFIYASNRLWDARAGKLGRITRQGLQAHEDAAEMFREQYEAALQIAKGGAQS